MKRYRLLIVLGSLCLGGCATTDSLDGRETVVIGYGRVTEGKSDRRMAWGDPASQYAKKPHVDASNTGMSSDSLRTVFGGQ